MKIIEVNTNKGEYYTLTGSTTAFYDLVYGADLNMGYVREIMVSDYGAKESKQYSDHPYMLIGLVWEKYEDIERAKEWFESLKMVKKFNYMQEKIFQFTPFKGVNYINVDLVIGDVDEN